VKIREPSVTWTYRYLTPNHKRKKADFEKLQENYSSLTADVTPCALASCSSAELISVLDAANAVCSCANAPGTVTTTCSTVSGTASATTTSATTSETATGTGTGTGTSQSDTTVSGGSQTTCVAIPASTPDCATEVAAIPSCAVSYLGNRVLV
jgi:hypothetical protein